MGQPVELLASLAELEAAKRHDLGLGGAIPEAVGAPADPLRPDRGEEGVDRGVGDPPHPIGVDVVGLDVEDELTGQVAQVWIPFLPSHSRSQASSVSVLWAHP